VRVPTNEEEDRYDQRHIDLATELVNSPDRRALIEESTISGRPYWKIFLPSGHDVSWLNCGWAVINNVKSDLKNGPIIREDLLFLEGLDIATDYNLFHWVGKRNFWLCWLIASVISIFTVLALGVFWDPSTITIGTDFLIIGSQFVIFALVMWFFVAVLVLYSSVTELWTAFPMVKEYFETREDLQEVFPIVSKAVWGEDWRRFHAKLWYEERYRRPDKRFYTLD